VLVLEQSTVLRGRKVSLNIFVRLGSFLVLKLALQWQRKVNFNLCLRCQCLRDRGRNNLEKRETLDYTLNY
jgi:hypothetical protein